MDPKVCLLDAQEAILDDSFTAARILVSEYRAFRARGGFEPPYAPRRSLHRCGNGGRLGFRIGVLSRKYLEGILIPKGNK